MQRMNMRSLATRTMRQPFWAALMGSGAALAALKAYSMGRVWRAKAHHPPVGQFLSVNGVRLHYLSQNISSRAGRPVVLLHAGGLVLQDFRLSIFDQVAASYHTIVFDRPGYGYSERPANEPLGLALNARLLHDALAQVGVERPILVGHSLGGSVALRYALDYPDGIAGLVLLAPGAYAEGSSVPPLFYLADPPLLGSLFLHLLLTPMMQMVAGPFAGGLFAPNTPPDGYADMLRAFSIRPGQYRTHAEELKQLPKDLRAQSSRYGEIGVPVAIVAGAADQVSPPEINAYPLPNVLPDARLVVLSATGHAVHHSHPEAVMDALAWVQARAIVG